MIDIENMAELSVNDKEAFALNRRKGFGASDSSILLGVNHWTTIDQLIEQKNSLEITADELAVADKPQVRMGADLEPLILQKFEEWSGLEASKPEAQYRLVDYPYLTINFDGLAGDVPVECKCISQFARKYWDFDKSMKDINDVRKLRRVDEGSVSARVEAQAKDIGIPPYYYTQVQQQLLGSCKTYAYLAALDVKEWTLHVFFVPEDSEIQTAIIMAGAMYSEQCDYIPT